MAVSSVTAQTTIEWWQFWTDPSIKPVIEQIVTEFEAQNPDIDVVLTDLTWANGHEKIVIALSSGRGPDVLELGSDWIAQFAEAGHLAQIGESIAGDSGSFDGWSMATYDGEVWGHPWILGTRVIFANRDLMRRAGFADDYIPITLDQFREAVAKVDSIGSDVYGWGSNTAEKHRLYKKYLPFLWSFGGQIFSDDMRYCLLASDFAINSLEYYRELHTEYGYVANQRGIEDAFLDGKIGFILSGDWLLKRMRNEGRTLNFTTTVFPGPQYPGRSFKGGEFLSINSASKNKEAALKLIKFVTSADNQVRFCKANQSANPSSKEAQKDEYFTGDPHLMTFIRQLRLANNPPVIPQWVTVETLIEDAIEDILFEDADPIADRLLETRKAIERVMEQ